MTKTSTADRERGASGFSRKAVVTSAMLAGGMLGLYAIARGTARGSAEKIRGTVERPDLGDTPSSPAYAELQRAKDAAEAANEAKTRYLVSVSHEIRSPLNAIYGYAQLLERAGAIPTAEAGAVIRRSAEHLTNLVESLLEISRIESGVIKIQSSPVDIRSLIDQLFRMLRVQAEVKGLYLKLEISDRLPTVVKTDEKKLRQILINLISNAIKYTQTGGVTVTINYRSQVAEVDVSDTGIGIGAEDLERVFEPFERGSSPDVQLQPGIGLGLAITRVLARVMGGDITTKSVLGAGSTFRLKLMLPEPMTSLVGVPESRRNEGSDGYEGDRRTVLVIDDDPAQIAVLQSFLRPLGFVVYAAANGVDGITLAAHCSADIVLLDIQMPGLSGWQTAEQLRAIHGDAIKIVMVSADVHEMMQAGDDGHSSHDAFLSKPVDLDAILAVIGRELRLRWTAAKAAAEAPPENGTEPKLAPLPNGASAILDRLHHAASIGHVRAIEEGLHDLREAFPASAELVSVLEKHLSDFDLRSFLKMLDDA